MLNFLVQITLHGQTLGSSLGHVFRKSGLILFIEVFVCSVQTDREEGGSAVTDLSAARATIRPTHTITIKPLHTLSAIIAIFTIAISSNRSILLSRFLQCNQNPSPTTSRLELWVVTSAQITSSQLSRPIRHQYSDNREGCKKHALHKCPKKSSLTVSYVCPVCALYPVSPVCTISLHSELSNVSLNGQPEKIY